MRVRFRALRLGLSSLPGCGRVDRAGRQNSAVQGFGGGDASLAPGLHLSGWLVGMRFTPFGVCRPALVPQHGRL